MGNRFASGKWAIAQCDRCDGRYKLKQLRREIIKTKNYELLVCPECWDPDQPQLQLGMFPVDDPQGLRNPRPDRSYLVSGLSGLQLVDSTSSNPNAQGTVEGGSRIFQWGWNPVGGAAAWDAGLTPNNLFLDVQLGDVTVELDMMPGAMLGGVSSTGSVGNALGPLPITGVSATGAVSSVDPPGFPITGISSTVSPYNPFGNIPAGIGMTFNIPGADFYLQNGGSRMRFFWGSNAANLSTINSIVGYLTPNNASGYVPSMNIYSNASTTNPVPVGTPLNAFGTTTGGQVWSIYSYTDLYLNSSAGGYPTMPDGHYYIGTTLQSVTEFSIPSANPYPNLFPPGPPQDGYNPIYTQIGPNSTLVWTGPAASTINSNYQQFGSQIGKRIGVGWITGSGQAQGGIIGTISSINYDSGTQTFTITMVTMTPMTNYGYITSGLTFLHNNL